MQTFLPYRSFSESAKCLDYRRLGKQRIECMQILQCLLVKESRWKNHPAIRMWRGNELALLAYGINICDEWISRGYKDTCRLKMIQIFGIPLKKSFIYVEPAWLTDEFCDSHRSNLLRKNDEYYSQFGWNVPNDLPYRWPI